MVDQTVKFRNVKFDDISSIIRIERESFEASICESQTVYEERIKVFPDGFRVMEADEGVMGFISSEIWEEQGDIKAESFMLGHSINENHRIQGETLYISSMGILPIYRGRGMGRIMFEAFLNYIQVTYPHLKSVLLIVSDLWMPARKIYQVYGFEEILKVKEFFCYNGQTPRHEDGIVMRKQFKPNK